MKIQVVLVAAIVQISGIVGYTNTMDDYRGNITWLVTKRDSSTSPPTDSTFTSTFANGVDLQEFCNVGEPITILVHGWTEKPTISWRAPLTSNFLDAREGGCVIWMDYGFFSGSEGDLIGYLNIVATYYPNIATVLSEKLIQLNTLGYNMANVHMFGFSLGSHVALRGAYLYKTSAGTPPIVGRIDVCDPAGSQFSGSSPSVVNAAASATNVQVIHTSWNSIALASLGTTLRFGHKDISMGNCGKTQAAGGLVDKTNHYLCPTFYINSFANNFPLISKPTAVPANCKTSTFGLTDQAVPSPAVTMGFRLDFSIPNGMYYAASTATSPYN